MFRSLALVCILFIGLAPTRILHIHVAPKEEVSIDGVKIDISESLSKELQQRLWRSFMGNGKMPDSIDLRFDEAVTPGVKASILKSIREAQEKTLNLLCLHKYKKSAADITMKQKGRLKKQYSVLFQSF
ncbi:MAG TPA: hypothetical protein VHM26_07050 [Chitinophagaceae bacterium]|nr:hypothetical protein [Chitinophagaceae bacterium]